MSKLGDELKRRRKDKPPEIEVEVKIDNDTAAALVAEMKATLGAALGVLEKVLVENSRLLTALAQSVDKLLSIEPGVPQIVLPPRPKEFGVTIDNDENGYPTAMRISVNENLH